MLEATLIIEGAAEEANFVNQSMPLHHAVDQSSELIGMYRLGYVVVSASFDRRHSRLDRAVSRDYDYAYLGILGSNSA